MQSKSTLSLMLETNFVMDYFVLESIKYKLMDVVPTLDDVKISFKYKDMVQTKNEIISAILRNMKDSPHERTPWINAISTDNFSIEEGTLKIKSCGISATENLNQKTAAVIKNAINRRFGYDLDVIFVHDKEEYERIKERKIKQEKMEAEQAVVYAQSADFSSQNAKQPGKDSSKSSHKKTHLFRKQKVRTYTDPRNSESQLISRRYIPNLEKYL